MDPQAFELLKGQLERIEDKVDDLVKWRYYFTGAAAIVGALFGGISAVVVSWFTGVK